MPPIIRRYFTRQLLFTVLFVGIVGTGPAIFVSLSSTLPGDALFTRLAWPALASVIPLILYHALPVLVAGSAVWCFNTFSAEGTLMIMQSAGVSPWSIRARIVTVAMWLAGFGYILAWVVVPWSAGYAHDVLFSLDYDVVPALLQSGRFNEIDHGHKVIFFENSSDGQNLTEIFVREKEDDGTERSYSAPLATITGGGGNYHLVLFDGSMQHLDHNQGRMEVVNFTRLDIPLTRFGNVATRTKIFVDELGPVRFFKARPDRFSNPEAAGWWWRDAAKRLGIPPLTLIHTLFGLSLLGIFGTPTRSNRNSAVLVCGVLLATHLAFVIVVEQVFNNPQTIWLLIGLVGAELGATLVLLALGHATPIWLRRSRSLAWRLASTSRVTGLLDTSRIRVLTGRPLRPQLHSDHRGNPPLPAAPAQR